MEGGSIVYLVCTIAQAPVLTVPLLHETGAFLKLRSHHNRFPAHQSDKITIVFTIL